MKENKRKQINFTLSIENEEILKKYEKSLPEGIKIKPKDFFNRAVELYIKSLLKRKA